MLHEPLSLSPKNAISCPSSSRFAVEKGNLGKPQDLPAAGGLCALRLKMLPQSWLISHTEAKVIDYGAITIPKAVSCLWLFCSK